MPEKLEQENVTQENVTDVDLDFDTLGRVSAAVLETMFFEESVETECAHGWLQTAISARVRFEGSHCGEFVLSVAPDAARCIAAGFLGLDPEELTEVQPGQVIQELTNILCGAVLSNVWPASNLSLDTPELASHGYSLPDGMHRCFTLPDGPVCVSISVGGGRESS